MHNGVKTPATRRADHGAAQRLRDFAGQAARIACLTVLAAALLAACQSDLPMLRASPGTQSYLLGAGDDIRVTVFDQANLSGQFTVDDNGAVAIPLAGPGQAEGLTTTGFADALKKTLMSRNLLADPNIAVQVVKYRPVYVLGEVQRPGPYPYQARMTYLNAVALAGGFTPRAAQAEAIDVRSTPGGPVKGRVDQLSAIQPGDIITVEERNF